MHHRALFMVGLTVLWLVLSGHSDGLLLSLGAVSVVLCAWIAARMELKDDEMHPQNLSLVALALYWFWLSKEIVLSALDVSRRVLSPRMPLSPTVRRLPVSARTELGRTVYANSITLTPGTVSIDLDGDEVQIHALTEAGADALAGGEMDRRVRALERDA